MARYGVNVAPAPEVAAPVQQEEQPVSVASRRPPRSALVVTLYAIAVAITPEFTVLGIPKVRFTDFLMPFLFMSYVTAKGVKSEGTKSKKDKSDLYSWTVLVVFWELAALFFWGSAKLNPGIFYIAKRVEYGLVALFVSGTVRSITAWNQVVRMLIYASPVLNFSVLYDLIRFQSMGGVYATQEGMRASGLIAQQQTSTALFITIISCISLGAWDAYKDKAWRLGVGVSLVTGCAALFATGSRGGLACIILTVVISAGMRPGRGAVLAVVGLAAGLIGWAFTPAALQQRLANIVPETIQTFQGLTMGDEYMPDVGSSSVAGRVVTAQWAFRTILPQAGLLGLGSGWKKLGALDNFYLSEWMYNGFLGLSFFMRLQWGLVALCWMISKKTKDPVEKGVAQGVLTALVVMSASGVHADTFYLIRPMECLAMLFGLVLARRAMSA